MNMQYRCRLSAGWNDFIRAQEPEYFITLTCRYPWSDRAAEEAIKFFIKRLVKSMPRRVIPNVVGVIAAERTVMKVHFDDTYHFHIVLWGINAGMEDANEWLPEAAIDAAQRLRSPSGHAHCHWKTVKVQAIEKSDIQKVAAYETKDINIMERPTGSQMLFLNRYEVIGKLDDFWYY